MRALLVIITLILSFNVSAQRLYCNGKVDNTYIDNAGNVYINGGWRNNWTKICNTGQTDVVTCSLWTSYVASAVQNNLDVTVNYDVSDGVTCGSLPTYTSAPKPLYIMIHNPN